MRGVLGIAQSLSRLRKSDMGWMHDEKVLCHRFRHEKNREI